MRIGAKELHRVAPAQLCRLQQIGVSPDVAGTRRRHKVPVVFCAVRVSTRCRALNPQHCRLYWVCPRSESNLAPKCLKLLEFARPHRRSTPSRTPMALGVHCASRPVAFLDRSEVIPRWTARNSQLDVAWIPIGVPASDCLAVAGWRCSRSLLPREIGATGPTVALRVRASPPLNLRL